MIKGLFNVADKSLKSTKGSPVHRYDTGHLFCGFEFDVKSLKSAKSLAS
jgi:hypothetical protein